MSLPAVGSLFLPLRVLEKQEKLFLPLLLRSVPAGPTPSAPWPLLRSSIPLFRLSSAKDTRNKGVEGASGSDGSLIWQASLTAAAAACEH